MESRARRILNLALNYDQKINGGSRPQKDQENHNPLFNDNQRNNRLQISQTNAQRNILTDRCFAPTNENHVGAVEVDEEECGMSCRKPKRRRLEGEKKEHNLISHPVLRPCKDKCRKKCIDKFSTAQREVLNQRFWNLDFSQRQVFLDQGIETTKPTQDHLVKHRSNTFHLTTELGKRCLVCKVFSLATLGMKTDGTLTAFITRREANNQLQSPTMRTKDERGAATPNSKIDTDKIRDHIESFHPQVSHYQLLHAPNRQYLVPNLSIKVMFDDYVEKHDDCKKSVYYRTFHEMNISFMVADQDKCDVCQNYEMHVKEGDDEHDARQCEICIAANQHQVRVEDARTAYKNQAHQSSEVTVVSADMQKVILLPKLPTKEHFFVSRLVTFNETFSSIGEGQNYVILWHEGLAGRLAADVTSAYIKFIEQCGTDEIVIWADNCTGQNKNWTIFTALTQCVNAHWGPSKITLRYLERGHTYMSADSVHGVIGKSIKKQSMLCNFQDFVDLCRKASTKIIPVCLQTGDFHDFVAGKRLRHTKQSNQLPYISDISEIQFRKGQRSFFFKKSFSDVSHTEVDFLKPKFSLDWLQARNSVRGINSEKKAKIVRNLVPAMPPTKRKFWLELPESGTSTDLVSNLQ